MTIQVAASPCSFVRDDATSVTMFHGKLLFALAKKTQEHEIEKCGGLNPWWMEPSNCPQEHPPENAKGNFTLSQSYASIALPSFVISRYTTSGFRSGPCSQAFPDLGELMTRIDRNCAEEIRRLPV